MIASAWARQRRLFALVASEATSGSTLLFGLAFVGLSWLIALAIDSRGMSAGIADPLNLSLTACSFLGPVIAGVAAVRSATLSRQGMLALASTTVRGRCGALLLSSGALAAWAVVGYLGLVAIILLTARLDGPAPVAAYLLAAQAPVFLCTCTVIGAAAGAWLPHPIVGPVLAVALFAWVNMLDLAEGPAGRMSPIYADIRYAYRLQPNALLLVGVTLTLAAIGAIVVASAFRPVRPARLRLLVTTGLAGVAAGVLAVRAAPTGDVTLRHGSTGECHSAEGLTLCAWPGPGVPFGASLRALVRVRDQAVTVGIPVPTTFHEPGLQPLAADSRPFNVPVVRPGVDSGGATDPALYAVLPPACDASSRRATYELIGLLVGRLDPGAAGKGALGSQDPTAPGRLVAAETLAEQRLWVRDRLEVLRGCQ